MSNDPTDERLERGIWIRPIKYRIGGTNNKNLRKMWKDTCTLNIRGVQGLRAEKHRPANGTPKLYMVQTTWHNNIRTNTLLILVTVLKYNVRENSFETYLCSAGIGRAHRSSHTLVRPICWRLVIQDGALTSKVNGKRSTRTAGSPTQARRWYGPAPSIRILERFS